MNLLLSVPLAVSVTLFQSGNKSTQRLLSLCAISIWESLFSEWASLISFLKKKNKKSRRRANALREVAVTCSSQFSNIHYASIFILQSSEKQIMLLHLVLSFSTKRLRGFECISGRGSKFAPDFFLFLKFFLQLWL